jgi:hypothetical protein
VTGRDEAARRSGVCRGGEPHGCPDLADTAAGGHVRDVAPLATRGQHRSRKTWQPELAIDQLAPGNTLTGWVVFTVPKPSSCILVTCADGRLMTHSKSNGRSPAASSIKSSADPADQSSS